MLRTGAEADIRVTGRCQRPFASKIADHPHIRVQTLAADGKMPSVRRQEPPSRTHPGLLPNGSRVAIEVNKQQCSATWSKG